MVQIAIIGGGIGGLTAALALQQFGFQAEVFEQAPELLEVGGRDRYLVQRDARASALAVNGEDS